MTNLPAILRSETGELKLPAKPIRFLGIDLGTTNSTVAKIAWNPHEGVVAAARCLTAQYRVGRALPAMWGAPSTPQHELFKAVLHGSSVHP